MFPVGPAGQVANATPASSRVAFGDPCAEPAAPGGLVYLNRHDPVSGDGDATVLSDAGAAVPARSVLAARRHSQDVTFVARAKGGRLLLGVRGGVRDGILLGDAP